jgi:hypothetical protein
MNDNNIDHEMYKVKPFYQNQYSIRVWGRVSRDSGLLKSVSRPTSCVLRQIQEHEFFRQ